MHRRLEVVCRTLGVFGARGQIVREHARRSAKYPVAKLDALVDGNVVLNLHTVAYGDVVGNVHVLTQAAALSNPGPRLNVAEVPHLSAVADRDPFVHDCGGVNERRH